MLLDRIEVVLVHPENPMNVGAAARAMKNCGIGRLCIVGDGAILADGAARATAHASEEILVAARVVPDLDAALADHVFAVGTASRTRKGKLPPLEPPATVLPPLSQATRRGTCSLVFGPESRGLTDEQLARCTRLLRVPTAVSQPSLNLGQAVLLVAHMCFLESGAEGHGTAPPEPGTAPTAGEFEELLRRVEALMRRAGFAPYAGDSETFLLAARRAMGRAGFERRDLRTFLLIVKHLERLVRTNPPEAPRSRGERLA